jgi:hypothetical protein
VQQRLSIKVSAKMLLEGVQKRSHAGPKVAVGGLIRPMIAGAP